MPPAGPIGPVPPHTISCIECIFNGLVRVTVGAGCAYAAADAILGVVRREKTMAKLHIHPVIPLELVQLGSSTPSGISIYATTGTAYLNIHEVGNLWISSQALDLAELIFYN
jgi:hypothetical protein